MADLLTPAYGYSIPGISMFSNPQGSLPLIGTRKIFGALSAGIASNPDSTIGLPATRLIDPDFPKAGRAYLVEYGSLQFQQLTANTLLSGFQILDATLSIGCGTIANSYNWVFGFPAATTLTPSIDLVSLVIANTELLIRTEDLLDLARVNAQIAPGPLVLNGLVAAHNVSPDTLLAQIRVSAIIRFVDGVYG